MVRKEEPMTDRELQLQALLDIRTIEIKVLTEERDRLRGSLASYEAELARVERELSAKNI
jgi:hypothetical protein